MIKKREQYIHLSVRDQDDGFFKISALIDKKRFVVHIDSDDNNLLYDGLCQLSLNVVNFKDAMEILKSLKDSFAQLYSEAFLKKDELKEILDELEPFVLKGNTTKLMLPLAGVNLQDDDKDLEIIHSAGVIDESRIINE